MTKNESRNPGVRQLARGILKKSLEMRERELQMCSAVEALLDGPDAQEPRVERRIAELCRDLGVTKDDRLRGIRLRRAELERAAAILRRDIEMLAKDDSSGERR